jgi:polyphosphate kinase 2
MGKKKKKKSNKKKIDKAVAATPDEQVEAVVATADEQVAAAEGGNDHPVKLKNKAYIQEMEKLQLELVRLQDWVKKEGLKVIVVFEGRDAAGKGGVLKRITERVSPRVFRVVALPAPSDREKSQLFFQRYINHFPAAGEIVLFDRSWYNRACVEHVMGFCNKTEYEEFLNNCPVFETAMVRAGIILIKYFFDVGQEQQERRFLRRINDPMRHWKLSPMDLESYRRWWDYTAAIDRMLEETDTEQAPWNIVNADDKKRARLNCISHMLSSIPYKKTSYKPEALPKLKRKAPQAPTTPRYKNFVPEVF